VLRSITTRPANAGDLEAIRTIYNQGIEDRLATLDTEAKSPDDIAAWWSQHNDRYAVLVAAKQDAIVGWASLNRFSHRFAHEAIADLSVYVARSQRGQSIGKILLSDLERRACGSFHKIVLYALNGNVAGKRLYAGLGFREVGVFREHGRLHGTFVDVVAMEKLLSPSI
jgi:phosphinothricin acetyltransferase